MHFNWISTLYAYQSSDVICIYTSQKYSHAHPDDSAFNSSQVWGEEIKVRKSPPGKNTSHPDTPRYNLASGCLPRLPDGQCSSGDCQAPEYQGRHSRAGGEDFCLKSRLPLPLSDRWCRTGTSEGWRKEGLVGRSACGSLHRAGFIHPSRVQMVFQVMRESKSTAT